MSDTPRTDAVHFYSELNSRPERTVVDSDFARQLERELEQAKALLWDVQHMIALDMSAMAMQRIDKFLG